jgi:NADH dehydrogenase FAD-containing subunit
VNRLRTVILVGAGHVHLHVAAQAREYLGREARVILIDPGSFWYSGLATGMLGGRYSAAEDQLDPQRLIETQQGEFVHGRVERFDPTARRVCLADGRELAYDYVSINVGSQVNCDGVAGAADDPSVWPVKPISNLWKLREQLERQLQAGAAPRVAVIGGGPTGCEVAANLAALARTHQVAMPVTLIAPGHRLIQSAPAGAARWLQQKLSCSDITLRLQTRVVRREQNRLLAEDGSQIEADLVVLATGLVAGRLVYELGLPTRPKDGLRINPQLHSIADPRVFAGGDCAALDGWDLPKLGVFGVRQAACIHANLLASLAGNPLVGYRPQRRYLSILNLGDGTGLSTWGPRWWHGRSSLWLKEWLDRRFLHRYRRRGAGDPGGQGT